MPAITVALSHVTEGHRRDCERGRGNDTFVRAENAYGHLQRDSNSTIYSRDVNPVFHMQ